MMLLTLCDAGANGVTGPKETYCISLNCLYLRKMMMPFMMLLASCDADTDPNGII